MIDKEAVLGAWEVANLPTPSYIIHETLLDANLATIDKVRHEAGVEIIVALKANATWHIFDKLAAHSDGATASSLAEARQIIRASIETEEFLPQERKQMHRHAPAADPAGIHTVPGTLPHPVKLYL